MQVDLTLPPSPRSTIRHLPTIMRRYSLPFLPRWAAQRAFRGLTSWGRTLPDFIIIGAQRSGTTSLYNYLVDHPGVVPAFMKETHFFDLHFHKGLGWYRAFFPLVGQARRRTVLVGESTPSYLFHPHTPRRVRAILPAVRLVVLLRNPVDRAYSHYHHEVAMGVETASFEQALEREEAVLSAETTKLLQDENYPSFAHFHYAYLARGIYVDQLERWRQFFDPEQILILRSEEFYQEPAVLVARVMQFLSPASIRTVRPATATYKRYNEAHYADMNPATRERLAAYFRPHNQRLYAHLGTDLGWQ